MPIRQLKTILRHLQTSLPSAKPATIRLAAATHRLAHLHRPDSTVLKYEPRVYVRVPSA